MKIALGALIMGTDGKPLPQDNGKDLTLRDVISRAVLNPSSSEKGEDKYADYSIFKKIEDAEAEADLSVEEVARVKKKIGELFTPLVVGRAWDLLEG